MKELVEAVRRYVEGKGVGVQLVVEGGRGVEEVVAGLKEAKVAAKVGRMETRSGKGLNVVVRVGKEGKGEAKFVGRVEVVERVEVRCGDTELKAADLGELGLSVEWADRNLDVRRMRNGDVIREAKSNEEWKSRVGNGETVWCHYGGDKENCKKWGKLYYAAKREELEMLVPEKWRIATIENWKELLMALGMEADDGNGFVTDEPVKAIAAWEKLLNGKFGAGLGGNRDNNHGTFHGGRASWAVSSGNESVTLVQGYYSLPAENEASFSYGSAAVGFSMRCVRDKPPTD